MNSRNVVFCTDSFSMGGGGGKFCRWELYLWHNLNKVTAFSASPGRLFITNSIRSTKNVHQRFFCIMGYKGGIYKRWLVDGAIHVTRIVWSTIVASSYETTSFKMSQMSMRFTIFYIQSIRNWLTVSKIHDFVTCCRITLDKVTAHLGVTCIYKPKLDLVKSCNYNFKLKATFIGST
jgi:hypothetical protein